MQQPLKFDVWDFDVESPEYLGGVETSLGAIVGSSQQTLILELTDQEGRQSGKIILRSEEVKGASDSIFLELCARGVEDIEVFSKSDPFLTIAKLRADNTWVKVHQTEYVPNNLNPIWRGFQLPISTLCGGDYFRPIRLEIGEP